MRVQARPSWIAAALVALLLCPLAARAGSAVRYLVGQGRMVGYNGAGIAIGAEILPRIETETTGRSHGTGFFAFVGGAVRLTGILDDLQTVFLGNFQN